MKHLEGIALALRSRQEGLQLPLEQLARRASCTVLQANQVLTGDPKAPVGVLVAIGQELGFTTLVAPTPAAKAVAAGPQVTEPKVLTKVEVALASLRPKQVALFIDMDGVVHATGDSRIDDQGQLVGEAKFRWWPALRSVLQEHPDVQVVVHSSWRKFWPSLEYLRPLLPADLAERVVGITDSDVLGRQESIAAYLARHPEIHAYVVLYDEADEFGPDVPLVVCHPKKGLGEAKTVSRLRKALASAKKQLPASPGS